MLKNTLPFFSFPHRNFLDIWKASLTVILSPLGLVSVEKALLIYHLPYIWCEGTAVCSF